MTHAIKDAHGRQLQGLRRHKSHRVVASFAPTIDYRAVLATEADTTRWWMLDQDMWLHSCHIVNLPAFNASDDTWKILAAFPLWRNPHDPIEKRIALFYLGCDAQMYRKTADSLVPFDFEREVTQSNLRYLIAKLRTARGAV